MRFTLCFKDPDGVDEGLGDASHAPEVGDARERAAVEEIRRQELKDFIGEWVSFGEVVRIDFDTDAGTAVVRKRS